MAGCILGLVKWKQLSIWFLERFRQSSELFKFTDTEVDSQVSLALYLSSAMFSMVSHHKIGSQPGHINDVTGRVRAS